MILAAICVGLAIGLPWIARQHWKKGGSLELWGTIYGVLGLILSIIALYAYLPPSTHPGDQFSLYVCLSLMSLLLGKGLWYFTVKLPTQAYMEKDIRRVFPQFESTRIKIESLEKCGGSLFGVIQAVNEEHRDELRDKLAEIDAELKQLRTSRDEMWKQYHAARQNRAYVPKDERDAVDAEEAMTLANKALEIVRTPDSERDLPRAAEAPADDPAELPVATGQIEQHLQASA